MFRIRLSFHTDLDTKNVHMDPDPPISYSDPDSKRVKIKEESLGISTNFELNFSK